METGSGILGRLSEKVLGWIALGLIVLAGVGVWQMGPAGRATVLSGVWRTLAWFATAAALPWLTRLFIGRLLELGSNWAGLALVSGYTLVNLVVGFVLMGGLPGGAWSWMLAVALLALAGTYNYLVCEYLAEQSGG